MCVAGRDTAVQPSRVVRTAFESIRAPCFSEFLRWPQLIDDLVNGRS